MFLFFQKPFFPPSQYTFTHNPLDFLGRLWYNDINQSRSFVFHDILPSIAKHNNVVLCRLRSSSQSHYVALAEGV